MRTRAVRAVVVLALAALFAWAVWGLAVGSPHARVGKPAPDFALRDLSGRTVHLSDFRGRLVLVNFWATWCQPCQEEIPHLVDLQRQAGGSLVIVGVDRMEPADEVAAYVRKAGIDYPVVLDATGAVSAAYGVSGQPESFWIGRDGTLLLHVPGPMTPADMQRLLAAFEGAG